MRTKWGFSHTRVRMWVGLWERAARNNPCESKKVNFGKLITVLMPYKRQKGKIWKTK